MDHSITFTDENNVSKNTYDDWYLIPSSRPVVSEPGVNFKYVDIPGRSGSIDLTGYLTTTPTKSDSSGSWDFYVENDHGLWTSRRDTIAGYLNGSEMKMILDDDPTYYYIGRFVMSKWTPGESHSVVTIDYRIPPYKYNSLTDEKVSL